MKFVLSISISFLLALSGKTQNFNKFFKSYSRNDFKAANEELQAIDFEKIDRGSEMILFHVAEGLMLSNINSSNHDPFMGLSTFLKLYDETNENQIKAEITLKKNDLSLEICCEQITSSILDFAKTHGTEEIYLKAYFLCDEKISCTCSIQNESFVLAMATAYNRAIKSQVIEELSYFIDKYPSSEKREEVILLRYRVALNQAKACGSMQCMKDYIQAYGDTKNPLKNEGLLFLDSLEFNVAKSDYEKLNKYIERSPSSPNLPEATRLLPILLHNKAISTNQLRYFEEFRQSYPHHPLINAINTQLDDLYFSSILNNPNQFVINRYITNFPRGKYIAKIDSAIIYAHNKRIKYADSLINTKQLLSKIFIQDQPNSKARPLRENEEPYDYMSMFIVHYGESAFRIDEIPFSTSGDWAKNHLHYFNDDGRTIAYTYYYSAYSTGCAEIIYETQNKVFNLDFKEIAANRELKDQDDNPMKISDCDLRSNEDYRIEESFESFTKNKLGH